MLIKLYGNNDIYKEINKERDIIDRKNNEKYNI